MSGCPGVWVSGGEQECNSPHLNDIQAQIPDFALGVTALADDLQAARDLANAACQCIHFEGAFHRTDIGDRILLGSP